MPELMYFFLFLALYLMYAKLEEDHGLARHAMSIYDRATGAVLPEEQNEVSFIVSIFDNLLQAQAIPLRIDVDRFRASRPIL